MKNLTYKTTSFLFTMLICFSLTAQKAKSKTDYNQLNKRKENFLELKNLGYNDREIFEDLGNANFLMENYETAVFWYNKLKRVSTNGKLNDSYEKRYEFSLRKANSSKLIVDDTNWLAEVKQDYKRSKNNVINDRSKKYKDLDFNNSNGPIIEDVVLLEDIEGKESANKQGDYKSPVAVTPDGNTAYFSKPIYVKPLYGVFSKKELVYKIFKADKVNGEWKNIQQVSLCPKNYSTKHPTISPDGKRLFFASNMPGTYGKYDIYVATVNNNGTYGVAKNLGEKVNTKKDDIHPNVIDDNTLVFASEGHKGYGGLDIYMAQVGQKKVNWSTNLGSPINSSKDDFSLSFEKGYGYVMSNRGKDKNNVSKVVFTYSDKNKSKEKRNYNTLENLNNVKIDYTSSVFEDE